MKPIYFGRNVVICILARPEIKCGDTYTILEKTRNHPASDYNRHKDVKSEVQRGKVIRGSQKFNRRGCRHK